MKKAVKQKATLSQHRIDFAALMPPYKYSIKAVKNKTIRIRCTLGVQRSVIKATL